VFVSSSSENWNASSKSRPAQLEIEVFENQLQVLLTVHRDCSAKFDWMAAVSALPPFQTMESNPSEYQSEFSSWQKTHLLATKVLKGDLSAYGEALSEISANGELATLGYSIVFKVENHETIACELLVCGNDVITQETKMLSASGKLASKPMPKARFHEIYQDYVCGCALRVAREIFALLPVNLVIVTAFARQTDAGTGGDGNSKRCGRLRGQIHYSNP